VRFRLTSVYSLEEPVENLEDSPGLELHYRADSKVRFEDCERLAEAVGRRMGAEVIPLRSRGRSCVLLLPVGELASSGAAPPEEVEV